MRDCSPYLLAWRDRWKRQEVDDVAAAAEARRVAGRLAQHLVERFGACRVILCGSLARGEFRMGSDIDLAAEGLSADSLFRAGAELERVATPLRVDLVPIESANEEYRRDLSRWGVVLHGS